MSNQAKTFSSIEGDTERANQRTAGNKHPEDMICRLEELWEHLAIVECTLTVVRTIYELRQIDNRLGAAKISPKLSGNYLEDQISILTTYLEEYMRPLATDWVVCKEEGVFLLASLRAWLHQTRSDGTSRPSASGGQFDGQ